MDIVPFLKSLEASGVAVSIRNSLIFFPMLEAVHVMALALVFGTIVVIDIRVLGFASAHRPFGKMSTDILKWTWAAFAVSILTGSLMFSTNAQVYANNTFFRIKVVLLVIAGLNMLIFHLTAGRTAHHWGEPQTTAPRIAKATAALSLVLWISIIFMGRLIGFTTTGQAAKEAPAPAANVDFDSFLSGPGNAASNTSVPSPVAGNKP